MLLVYFVICTVPVYDEMATTIGISIDQDCFLLKIFIYCQLREVVPVPYGTGTGTDVITVPVLENKPTIIGTFNLLLFRI
jgi:hypothetical protein